MSRLQITDVADGRDPVGFDGTGDVVAGTCDVGGTPPTRVALSVPPTLLLSVHVPDYEFPSADKVTVMYDV
jgi:hypothetical protein